MATAINFETVFASGASMNIGVVNGQKCLILKVTDPAQVIVVDAMTTALPIVKVDLIKSVQKGQAAVPLFDNIVLS